MVFSWGSTSKISFNTVNPPIPESKMPIDFSKAFYLSTEEQWCPAMIFFSDG
jgi:hypothetical protein